MVNQIKNPWHSRPIDVHRWSNHPEVRELVDRIWEGFLDLYAAWLDDPETT